MGRNLRAGGPNWWASAECENEYCDRKAILTSLAPGAAYNRLHKFHTYCCDYCRQSWEDNKSKSEWHGKECNQKANGNVSIEWEGG